MASLALGAMAAGYRAPAYAAGQGQDWDARSQSATSGWGGSADDLNEIVVTGASPKTTALKTSFAVTSLDQGEYALENGCRAA